MNDAHMIFDRSVQFFNIKCFRLYFPPPLLVMLQKTCRLLLGEQSQHKWTDSAQIHTNTKAQCIQMLVLSEFLFYCCLRISLLNCPHLPCCFLRDLYHNTPSSLNKKEAK